LWSIIFGVRRLNELGRNARREAVEKYTWDKNVERTLNALRKVLD